MKTQKPLFSQGNVLFFLSCTVLVLMIVFMLVQIGNADYTRLGYRLERVGAYLQTVGEELARIANEGASSLGSWWESLKVEDTVSASPEPVPTWDPRNSWEVLHVDNTVPDVIYSDFWQLPEEVVEVMENPEMHEPSREQFFEETSRIPEYTHKELKLADSWVVNMDEKEVWDHIAILDLNWSHTEIQDGKPVLVRFSEWRVRVKGTPFSFELKRSDYPGFSKMTWTDELGKKYEELVPFYAFIKVGYGTGATYLYQSEDGMIHFTRPIGMYPMFQVGFYALPHMLTSQIVDSRQSIPYGLITDEGSYWMLHREWTQNIKCPLWIPDSVTCLEID